MYDDRPLTANGILRPAPPDLHALAAEIRRIGWEIAVRCVDASIEQGTLPALGALGAIQRVGNLPAFVGACASALDRPHAGGTPGVGANVVLQRLAREHIAQRQQVGFTARDVFVELLALRRMLWACVAELTRGWDGALVVAAEAQINGLLDEVLAECAVAHFDTTTHDLSEQSRRDSLTGLLNHQAFHRKLDVEIDRCRRYSRELHVIYFDLDNFKQVNDGSGHATGDRVLKAIAQIIEDSIRDSDFAGRLGGDEFAVALVESGELTAQLLLDRLRARLARRIADQSVPACVGISAGTAGFPGEATNSADLLAMADSRQYADKRSRKAQR